MKELSDSKRWHPYLRELWSGPPTLFKCPLTA